VTREIYYAAPRGKIETADAAFNVATFSDLKTPYEFAIRESNRTNTDWVVIKCDRLTLH
jgi:hypothetical protein